MAAFPRGAFVLALLCSPPAQAQWVTALGGTEARDGRIPTEGPTTLDPGWELLLPNQMALQPVVADGRVFVARTSDFQDPSASEIVALNLHSGEVLWTTSLPLGPQLGLVCRPLAYGDGRLYATRAGYPLVNESLYALDPEDGSILWESEDTINIGFDSPVFAPDGDILINGEFLGAFLGYRLLRIDASDGSTVWSNTEGTIGDSAGGVRRGDRWYRHHFVNDEKVVTRFDMSDGTALYSSPASPFSPNDGQQSDLMLGPDGTVYRSTFTSDQSAAKVIAYEDTGSALVERWQLNTLPLPWSSTGITSQGDALLYSDQYEILRVDPATGSVLDRSAPLGLSFATARMAVDAFDNVFVTAHESGAGEHRVTALDADLDVLWSETLLYAGPTAGATLAQDGTLIATIASSFVAPGMTLKTWRGEGCGATSFCVAADNSTGGPASIASSGSFSVGENALVLRASGLPPSQPGIFYFGADATLLPLGGGFRCIANPAYRLPPVVSDAQGRVEFVPDLGVGPGIQAGERWNFQFWYRDPAAGGSDVFNLTQGIEVRFCP